MAPVFRFLPMLLSTASMVSARRQRLLEGRSSEFDLSKLNCEIGSTHDTQAGREFVSQDFEFWYAMGIDDDSGYISAVDMFDVEQLVYTSIEEQVLWCTEIIGEGGETRRLGVVTFTPGTADVQMEYACPTRLNELRAKSGASACRVVKGEMSILAHAADDVSYAVAGLRDGIETAMANGLGQQGELSSVRFLTYLGDSESEAFATDGSGLAMFIAFALGIPLFAALLAAAMFAKKKQKELKVVTNATYKDEQLRSPGRRVFVGTGDPPRSYHDGRYHHMFDGTRYLSTQCERCATTRRDEAFDRLGSLSPLTHEDVSHEMGTIPEDEPYRGAMIIRANSRCNLEQQHMGMDVHKCSSATCQRCNPQLAAQTKFLPVISEQDQLLGTGTADSVDSSFSISSGIPLQELADIILSRDQDDISIHDQEEV